MPHFYEDGHSESGSGINAGTAQSTDSYLEKTEKNITLEQNRLCLRVYKYRCVLINTSLKNKTEGHTVQAAHPVLHYLEGYPAKRSTGDTQFPEWSQTAHEQTGSIQQHFPAHPVWGCKRSLSHSYTDNSAANISHGTSINSAGSVFQTNQALSAVLFAKDLHEHIKVVNLW